MVTRSTLRKQVYLEDADAENDSRVSFEALVESCLSFLDSTLNLQTS